MKIKLKLYSLLLEILSIFAFVTVDVSETTNAPSIVDGKGIHCISTLWITKNMDPNKFISVLENYMIWEDARCYRYDLDNNVYLKWQIKKDIYWYTVIITFKSIMNSNAYGRMVRFQEIELVNNAEHVIAATDTDNYCILADGNTYHGDLGVLLVDAMKKRIIIKNILNLCFRINVLLTRKLDALEKTHILMLMVKSIWLVQRVT